MKNKRGSAIIWAVMAIMIIMVVLVGMLGVSLRHAQRGVDTSAERQAYLTARSAVDAMLEVLDGYSMEIAGGKDKWGNVTGEGGGALSEDELWDLIEEDNPLLLRTVGSTKTVTGFDFGAYADGMGSIEHAGVTRINDDTWEVSATAEYNDIKQTVSARLHMSASSAAGGSTEVIKPARMPVKDIFHGVCIGDLVLMGYSEGEKGTLSVNDAKLYLGGANAASGAGQWNQKVFRLIRLNGGELHTSLELGDPNDLKAGLGNPDYDRELYIGQYDRIIATNTAAGDLYTGKLPSFGLTFVAGAGIKDGASSVTLSGSLPWSVGSGNTVYCKVSSDASFNLQNVAPGGRLYIFVEPGKTLTLSGSSQNNAYTYIYGAENSSIKYTVDWSTPNSVKLNGALIAHRLDLSRPGYGAFEFVINYEEPSANADIAFTDGGSKVTIEQSGMYSYEWSFESYA